MASPTCATAERARYAGRRTLVVGSGHSAFNAILDLVSLGDEVGGTDGRLGRAADGHGLMFGGGGKDELEARGALGTRLEEVVRTAALGS
jgi:hypothetical protein